MPTTSFVPRSFHSSRALHTVSPAPFPYRKFKQLTTLIRHRDNTRKLESLRLHAISGPFPSLHCFIVKHSLLEDLSTTIAIAVQ
jgi:hypothetical protein